MSEDQATIEVSEDSVKVEADAGPGAQPGTDQSEQPKQQQRGPEDYEAEIAKLRKENANWRTKYREAEPIVKQHQEMEEANKTELQKAQEALQAREREFAELQTGYTRLELAAIHNIPPDDIDLIGSGSREEMEARAARLGALHAANSTKNPAPPSDRPVEGLRPGASPEPPKPEDDSYPESWKPAFLRNS